MYLDDGKKATIILGQGMVAGFAVLNWIWMPVKGI